VQRLVIASLLTAACSTTQQSTPAASKPTQSPGKSAPLDARADEFVAAWRRAKHDKGPSINSYLAEHVMLRYQRAADEPNTAPSKLDRADAAKRLTDAVEGFVVGSRTSCDARCCQFDTNFQRSDLVAAIASICFDHDLVTDIEAQP
jgi:hypothetical protein